MKRGGGGYVDQSKLSDEHREVLEYSAPDTSRYRIGAWRFFYEIEEVERLVLMIAAAHRRAAY